MKSKSFNEQQVISMNMHQSGLVPQFMPMRSSNIGRDFSNDQKIRRMSPIPQERFSHISTNYLFPVPTFQPNEYQLPMRTSELMSSSQDSKKTLQELIQRIEKLELRSQKAERLQFRVERLQNTYKKVHSRIEGIEGRSEDSLQGNQNRMNLENSLSKSDDDFKQRVKNLITREELQRQLIGLDSAFKTLIKEMKSNTNTEMREVHTKQKKTMIEVVASQISDKLEAFKQNFVSELSSKIQLAVRQTFNKEFINKSKFIGTTIPLKVSQELHCISGGVERELARVQTTYYIDNQGFILDSSFMYLLNKHNNKIKLTQDHLDVLKKEGLFNHHRQGIKLASKESNSNGFNER